MEKSSRAEQKGL